ncbi:HLA class II histocompatibility antigen, DM beta chain-like [Alligator sinensis]|uniref:HLA class II histocompatibility antigen, DM beta chain-like n=1 Tax=Alligator sinensis TaxID=38654 RepID=A0A3Q0HK97_ALLSI|nr:HLA class II histocompatibility antigen, DM beta chain-like [Alligator sinensis]
MQVLWLLLAGLSCHGAGGFMMHLVTECPVAANGSVLAVDVYLAFNKNRLVCYDPKSHLFYGCDSGLLQNVAFGIASTLNMNRTFIHLAASKQQGCQDQIQGLWAQTALRRRAWDHGAAGTRRRDAGVEGSMRGQRDRTSGWKGPWMGLGG